MWDAWAAYDPIAAGYLFREKLTATDVDAARAETISYAAYRVLRARFATAVGAEETLFELKHVMRSLCYPVRQTSVEGSSPSAVGNRIAARDLAARASRRLERGGWLRQSRLCPGERAARDRRRRLPDGGSEPLAAAPDGRGRLAERHRHDEPADGRWARNGAGVDGFGILDPDGDGVAFDPGPQPRLGDPATDAILKDQLVELIRDSSLLDPGTGTMIDISPAALGANDLGTNDGTGHPVNPVTGEPYSAQVVNQADFMRAATQFWADGPASETPPGHWNVLANDVSDELEAVGALRIAGTGPVLDRLEWDVKLYLAINGAVHNAAIAAWGLKGKYDSSRPISLIRYMGGLGQSSDPARPSYDPEGLPLVRGLIELITPASSRRGQAPPPASGSHRRDRGPAPGRATPPSRGSRPAAPAGSWRPCGRPTSSRRS